MEQGKQGGRMKCYTRNCPRKVSVSMITTINGNFGVMHHFCKQHGDEKTRELEKVKK